MPSMPRSISATPTSRNTRPRTRPTRISPPVRLDAVQADAIALDAFLKTDQGKECCDKKGDVAPDLAVLGPGVGAGLRKEDTELLAKINEGIKAIRSDGSYDTMTKKYFDFDIYGSDAQAN